MIEEIIGMVLGLVVLLDIFLLILYARANKTIMSTELSDFAWRVLVWLSKPLGRFRETFLTFSGPIILVMVLASWALLLSLAAALIIPPNLGTAIITNHGDTPTDFLTALYMGGSSLSFIGASDFIPQTSYSRLFYLFTSLIGVSLASLIVTYLMEVYGNLKYRNALGIKVHLLSAETGDAAEAIAGIGPQGDFNGGYQILAQWSADTAQVKESHHFYPVLFYFRFREPYYSVSRTALTSLDAVTLIKTALDDREFKWLKESAAVNDLWRGALMQVKTLAENFLPDIDMDAPADEKTRSRWLRRYEAGCKRLEHAGIKTSKTGAEEYVAYRTQWDRYITLLAPKFEYDMNEIDTALAKVK